MSPSFNHSYVQSTLIGALLSLKQYSVLSELSLEIEGREYVPDICLYSKRKIDLLEDILKMTEMPLLAIEILSPSQVIQELTNKIKIYLNAGIQSCWLVVPTMRTIAVYNELETVSSYSKDEIMDKKLDINLSLDEIFPF